ncbi:MAG: exodeoxyribonuclease VII small subunit [Candidatus Krumholzibacteria bacterium]|nr:exodeoxyribonuclease VII small subunit [Candidatus Krumholzibacteria bacterium]
MARKFNFEEAASRLEEIVKHLEEGEVPLEESIKLYEEGMKLGKMCRRILNEAEQRIRQLSADIEGEKGGE